MTVYVNKQETTQMFIKGRVMTYSYNEILSISENIQTTATLKVILIMLSQKKYNKPSLK